MAPCGTCASIPDRVDVSLKPNDPQGSMPDAAGRLDRLTSEDRVYEDMVSTTQAVFRCPGCGDLFLRVEQVEHLVLLADHDIALVRLTDPVHALWNLLRFPWEPARARDCRREAARLSVRARERGPIPPSEGYAEAYAWYAQGPYLSRHEYGILWAALPPRARMLCAVEATAMAVDVWEALVPKEGFEYCIPEILESYDVPFGICRQAVEDVRAHADKAGAWFRKHRSNPLDAHGEALATGELSFPGAADEAFRAVRALVAAAMVDPSSRKELRDVENDPLWIPISLALGAAAAGKGREAIAAAADAWWARCRAAVPGLT